MFSPQSPSRTNIEEANKHLQMLHNRISELEQTIESQADTILALQTKEEELVELSKYKETENLELKKRLEVSNQQLRDLLQQNEQKDMAIRSLKGKCKHVAEIVSYQHMLQNLVSSMSKVNLDRSEAPSKSHRKTVKMEVNGSDKAAAPVGDGSKVPGSHPVSSKSAKFLQRTLNHAHRLQNLSVSDDEYDADEDVDRRKTVRKMKRDKELYLWKIWII